MTGGGRGFCAVSLPAAWPAYMGRVVYSPYGMPRGTPYYGEGATTQSAMPFTPQVTRDQELDFLKNQSQAMREHLEQIEARIQELGSKKE